MRGHYDRMFVSCPMMLSGGPEAIHQLAQLANETGLDTAIAYSAREDTVGVSEGKLIVAARSAHNVCLEGYGKYNPVVASGVDVINSRTLIVLPEVIAYRAEQFRPADVAIWWLSVRNAFHPTSPLRDEAYRRKYLANPSIIHLCQTAYASNFLRKQGVKETFALVDYTDDRFTLRRPVGPNQGGPLAFNPAKGGPLAEAFFEAHPDLTPRRIEEMTKAQVLDALRQTRIYVEFGHNPGNDRMPREAACAGCIVLARNVGGTASFDDVPLPEKFKFSEEDLSSGRLADLIRTIYADPWPFWEEQAYYRRHLYTERDLMRLQVERLFGVKDRSARSRTDA